MRLSTTLAMVAFASTGCGSIEQQIVGPIRPRGIPEVRLRVEAPQGVELRRRDEQGESLVCTGACDVTTSLGAGVFYHAAVLDLPDSPSFRLPESERPLVVVVRTAPRIYPGLGAVLSTLGGAAVVLGGLTVGGAEGGRQGFENAGIPGLATMAVGAAVLAGGLVFAGLSGTHVTVSDGGVKF